jgi:hypothetical protein
MRLTRNHLLRSVIAASAAGGLLLSFATPASAHGDEGRPPVISLDVSTAGGFSMPDQVHAGFVTFTISTSETGYHGIQGFRTNNGATVDDVVADLALGVQSSSRADNAEGARRLLNDAVLIGGAVTTPLSPISVTVALQPGTYYFFDLNDFFVPFSPPRLHTLQAVGHFHWAHLPRVSAVITATMSGDDPVFVAPTHLDANGTFLVIVTADEIHEAVLRPVRAGITDDYISTYYDAVVAGTPRPQTPWTGRQFGLQAMSPGRIAFLHMDLPAGDYALICFVPSDESGLPHGYIGMHQVESLSVNTHAHDDD